MNCFYNYIIVYIVFGYWIFLSANSKCKMLDEENVKIMEKFGVPEPHWILDQTETGPLCWRRGDKNVSSGNKLRVRFRCEPDIREFSRSEHELEEIEWPDDMNAPGSFIMGLTCLFCIAISVILPWYIIGGGTTSTFASNVTAAAASTSTSSVL